MQDVRPVSAAVPASHGLRATYSAFKTLYAARLVTGAVLVFVVSFLAVSVFAATSLLHRAVLGWSAELGLFFLGSTASSTTATLDKSNANWGQSGDSTTFIYILLAVFAVCALWHCAVHVNSGVLNRRAAVVAAAFGAINFRQFFLLLTEQVFNVTILFSALFLGSGLQLHPQECLAQGTISVGTCLSYAASREFVRRTCV